MYCCWGCGVSGNVIDWMCVRYYMMFLEVVEYLVGICGMLLLKVLQDNLEDVVWCKYLVELYQVFWMVVWVFLCGFDCSQLGWVYLEIMCGLSVEIIVCYDLGVVEKGVVGFMENMVGCVVFIVSGLVVEWVDGIIYDCFCYCVMFFIYNEVGMLIGFVGCLMLEKFDKMFKYINSLEIELFYKGCELYGLYLVKQVICVSGVVVVVEGYFDVIGFG